MAKSKHERSRPIQDRPENSLHSVDCHSGERQRSESDLPGVTIDESGRWVARVIPDHQNQPPQLTTVLPAADASPQEPAINCQASQSRWQAVAEDDVIRPKTRLPFPMLEPQTQGREPDAQIKIANPVEINADQCQQADPPVLRVDSNVNFFKLSLVVAIGLTLGVWLSVMLTAERRQPEIAGANSKSPATPTVGSADSRTNEFDDSPIPVTTEPTHEVPSARETDIADTPIDGFDDLAPAVEIEVPRAKIRAPVEAASQSPDVLDRSDLNTGIADSATASPKPKLKIQTLTERQLKSQLHDTVPTVDLFRNVKEFNSARAFLRQPPLPPGVDRLQQQINEARERLAKFDARRPKLSGMAQKNRDRLNEDLASLLEELEQLSRQPINPLEDILGKRKDLQGLPLVMGETCHLDESEAIVMDRVSKSFGQITAQLNRSPRSQFNPLSLIGLTTSFGRAVSQGSDQRKAFANQLESCDSLGNPTQVLSTLDQILQVNAKSLRLELVPRARRLQSDAGMELLVRKALFDFSSDVRAAANDALTDYPIEKVRERLLNGFEYPWHVVAQHAAESIVWLDDQAAVPYLVEKLKRPDPRLPVEHDSGKYTQRQLVSISHLKNCLLCHAPSTSQQDYGRGLSPAWETEVAPSYGSAAATGEFVRADVTYLRQDFSLIQPVEDSGHWPANQRFDYVVQAKKLTRREASKSTESLTDEPNLHREAVVLALETLTGENPADDEYETWLAVIAKTTNNDEAAFEISAR